MLKTVIVSENGQIIIPKEIQELLGIQKGDSLSITAKNETILIQKTTNIEKHTEDNFGDLSRYSESSLGELWNNKSEDVWEKYL